MLSVLIGGTKASLFAAAGIAMLGMFRSRRPDDGTEPAQSAERPAARPPDGVQAGRTRPGNNARLLGGETQRGAPPNPRAEWSAEVEWIESHGSARFAAVARAADAERTFVVAESPTLRWPPSGPGGVQALADAVAELERLLLDVGWTSLPAGAGWYAKRFAWKPRAAPPAPAPAPAPVARVHTVVSAPARPGPPPAVLKESTGRFRRPSWPEGSDRLWRCELRWEPGLVNSRFEAVARDPDRGARRVVGASATFKWLMMGDPDPTAAEYRAELGRLTAALERVGWEHVGRGSKWFSDRFVWKGAGAPTDVAAPARGAAGRTP